MKFTAHIFTNIGHQDLQHLATQQGVGQKLTMRADRIVEISCRQQNLDEAIVPTKWSERTNPVSEEAAVATTPIVDVRRINRA